MGIVVKQFNGSSVTPKDDAVMNELIFQSYGIFNGCGISFLGVNQLMINSGRMIVKGRQVVITEETIAAQLSSGGTKRGRLYIRLDLSSLDNPASFLTQAADELPALTQQDDLNYNDGIFEIELCNYDVSETAISNIVESCPMITGSVDLLKSVEELLANTEEGKAVDALIVKQLYDSLTTLTKRLNTFIKQNTFLDIWSAGLSSGFTPHISSNRTPSENRYSYSVSYQQFFARFSISASSYTYAGGHMYTNKAYDLTEVQQIEMIYNTTSGATAGSWYGIGVSKEIISGASYTNTNYDTLLERCFYINNEGNVTDRVMTLDVSDLQGDYYVYVLVTTPTSSNISFDVISIHGLYI